MVIINLRGGLGNQMFQYAAGREIEIQTGHDVVYSKYYITREPNYDNHINSLQNLNISRKQEMNVFWGSLLAYYNKIKFRVCCKTSPQEKENTSYKKMLDRHMLITNDVHAAPPLYEIKNGTFIDCYFQNASLFANFAQYADELKVRTTYEPNEDNNSMLKKIQSSNAVCVHIRRGDYTSSKWAKDLLVCDEDYYQKGFEYILNTEAEPVFFVFSNTHNDLKWIQDNYNLPGKKVYVDLGNRDFEELFLMYHCKHFILSNSSFSWWAQKLALDKKNVVAPKKWNNREEDFSGIYEKKWILL